MGLFDRWRENRAQEVQVEDNLLKSILGGSSVNRDMAMQVPTVSGGIDLIAGIVAATPVKLYRENDGKASEVIDDPRLYLLNDEPGDTLNANDFWRAMVRDYYLGKGGFAYIDRRGNRPIGLYYVDERQITLQKAADPIFKQYNILVAGKSYLPYRFFRILRNTRDGMEGVPITEESSELIQVAYSALLYERNLVKKGGNKRGFLQSARKLDDAAMKKLKEGFRNQYSSTEENVIVLNDGVTFTPSSSTSVEMQLNENKKTNAAEFAKIFHVPSGVVGGQATQNDIASLARLAAIPLMQAIQCSLNRDLLLESEKGTMYFAFDTKELLKGDIASRFAAYKTALEANFMQIDEVRFAEDLEPLGLTWIKLGLNDVLYDPKSKTIYTPNTDKTSKMGENALQEEPESSIIEPRAKYIKGPDGKFQGSVSEGGTTVRLPNGKKVDRGYDPSDYSNLTVGYKGNKTKYEVGDWADKSRLEGHFDDHGGEVGAKDAKDYEKKAHNFMAKPATETVEDLITDDGHRLRYDFATNEFGSVDEDGGIHTYYTPKKKAEYWTGKVIKDHGKKRT